MYIRYKDKVGRLMYYEVLTGKRNGEVKMSIETKDGEEIGITCKESQVSIPCIAGNSKILFEIFSENEKNEKEETK